MGYSDYLTSFCEPVSPQYSYRCHTSFKNMQHSYWFSVRFGIFIPYVTKKHKTVNCSSVMLILSISDNVINSCNDDSTIGITIIDV